MSVDSGLSTIARLLTGIQKRANQSFALGMCALNSNSLALSVVSNFRRSLRVASPRNFVRACVFCPPTIAIAKIRDYSQSSSGFDARYSRTSASWFFLSTTMVFTAARTQFARKNTSKFMLIGSLSRKKK